MSCSCCLAQSVILDRPRQPYIDATVLAERCPLDNKRKSFSSPRLNPGSITWNESRLQSLPIELYQACLQHLDVQSLTNMRGVSQYTRFAIDGIYQYGEIYKHAPQALRACLSTEVACHIPLRRLHHALTSMECYFCKNLEDPKSRFGTYLSLYECRRCCLFCLRNSPELKQIELMAVMSLCTQRKGCSIRMLQGVPRLKMVPDSYGITRYRAFVSKSFVLSNAVAALGMNLTDKDRRTLFGNDRTAVIYHHPLVHPEQESNIQPTLDFTPPDLHKLIAQTYMSAVPFPYLTSDRQHEDFGVLCEECLRHMLFQEDRWKQDQQRRRVAGGSPIASERRRAFLNGLREKACQKYSKFDTTNKDAKSLALSRGQEYGPETVTSIETHMLTHSKEILSEEEKQWRTKRKRELAVS
ncbi:hypothetical protein BGZ60DRAFT_521575 [Tricladium varicosporioides]|nr:hypothetical protein BGZ60DRAFT_521575 [Hymenoscyphus varicosporioides]